MNKIIPFLVEFLSGLLGKKPTAPSISEPLPPPTSTRGINEAGIALIKQFEGFRKDAYLDSVGIATIGYGHTGSEVHLGLTWTDEEVNAALEKDLEKFNNGVNSLIKVEVTDNQFSAIVCFSYNVGLGNLKSSTLLKKVNAKDFAGAAEEFLRWNKAGGQILAGLTRRREAERALFLS